MSKIRHWLSLITRLSAAEFVRTCCAGTFNLKAVKRSSCLIVISYRYFRQISYGCTNPRCNATTCLSAQKRRSRGPFRRLNNLSTWTLAHFLAIQDDAEAGLCFNEPVMIQKGPGQHVRSRELDIDHITIINNTGSVDNLTASASRSPQNCESTYATLGAPKSPGNSRTAKSSHKKDRKSFSQHLFDTVAMRTLHLMKVPEGYFKWQSWGKIQDNVVSSVEGEQTLLSGARPHDDDGEPRLEERSSSELLSHANDKISAKSSTSDVGTTYKRVQMKGFAPGLRLSVRRHLSVESNMPNSALIASSSACTSEFARNFWQIDAGFAQSVLACTMGGKPELSNPRPNTPKDNLDYLVDDLFPTVPVDTEFCTTKPPQSLSVFTMENVATMVFGFENSYWQILGENSFFCSLGRTVSPFRLDSFVSGTATQFEREAAFAPQSIISVLSSVDLLSRSFRGPVNEPGDWGCGDDSDEFLHIVYAFHGLFQIDFYPGYVLPSLLTSANKLCPIKVPSSESSKLKECVGSPASVSNTQCEEFPGRNDALNDDEARQIAKIMLAALVAYVRQHDDKTWATFCEAQSTGRTINYAPGCVSQLQNLQLKLYETFDDDLGIDLMTRLVRGMVARRYMSGVAGHQESRFRSSEELREDHDNIIDVLLRDIFCVVPTEEMRAAEVAKLEAASCYFHMVLLQWLRSVISKNWDGKAVIQKWGAVGCALEFMSHLCASGFQ